MLPDNVEFLKFISIGFFLIISRKIELKIPEIFNWKCAISKNIVPFSDKTSFCICNFECVLRGNSEQILVSLVNFLERNFCLQATYLQNFINSFQLPIKYSIVTMRSTLAKTECFFANVFFYLTWTLQRLKFGRCFSPPSR